MKLYLYRVFELYDEGPPVDLGVVRADGAEHAWQIVRERVADLYQDVWGGPDEGDPGSWTVRLYPLEDRVTPGVLDSPGEVVDKEFPREKPKAP
jgi:hypothetical protein